ncbi:MAG: hypothetical protein MUQ65_11675 [Armatimonadetes bacterium]|nr:hypothetical protein [Armatimonadota bacterium]
MYRRERQLDLAEDLVQGDRRNATCPRCGRRHEEPELVLCEECRGALRQGAGAQGGEGTTITVQVGPILSEAVASAGPGEDVDEALLRVLKAGYPEEAASLLSAISRIVEIEARQSGESKEQAVRRLAALRPGPEIALRRSARRVVKGGFAATVSETVSETQHIRVGGKEYHSLEDVPPEVRRAIEEARGKGGTTRRVVVSGSATGGSRPGARNVGLKTGCSWALMWPVLRLLGR